MARRFGEAVESVWLQSRVDVLYDPRRTYLGTMEFEQLVTPKDSRRTPEARRHMSRGETPAALGLTVKGPVSGEAVERMLCSGERGRQADKAL